MPYISPSLSPTKAFASMAYPSPPNSNPSSPGSSTQNSPSSGYLRGTSSSAMVSSNSAQGALQQSQNYSSSSRPGVQFSSSYLNGFPRRPNSNNRHHSRSHSSDTLVTMSSAKATPGYIFVQPASPAPDRSSTPNLRTGDLDSRSGSYSPTTASPTSASPYSMSFNSQSAQTTPSSSYLTSPSYHYSHLTRPALRPASSSAGSSRTITKASLTSGDAGDVAPPRSARRSKTKFHLAGGSSSTSATASADSSPRGSVSLEAGKAFALPLPDLDAMSPPAFANRSSSSPALLSAAEESQRQLGAQSSTSATEAIPEGVEDEAEDFQSGHAQHTRGSAYSETSARAGSLSPNSGSSYESLDDLHADMTPHGHRHDHRTLLLRSTDLRPDDSALATSSESNSSAECSGSDTEQPSSSNELNSSPVKSPGGRPDSSRSKSALGWGDLPTPTMGSSTSFSFGNARIVGDGGHVSPSMATNNGIESNDDAASTSPEAADTPRSSSPPTGALAPAAFKVKRPYHVKSFSERRSSPSFEPDVQRHHRHGSKDSIRIESDSAGANRSGQVHDSQNHYYGQPQVFQHPPLHYLHSSGSGSGSGSSHRKSAHRPPPLPTPMLRKKSGELVKSSMKHESSKAKSAPTTPTGPKAVHFDEQLEKVKLFLAQQRPAAVSRDGSPIETETEDDSEAAFPFPPMTTSIPAQISLVMPDFPHNALPELGNRDVCLETLEIAADWKSLKGTCLLRNIAFEKRLQIRFTLDDWQTISEVMGEWGSTLVGGSIDRWTFNIKLQDMLARIEDRKMYIAIKYCVAGREIWDNNNGRNYLVEFRKQAARAQAVVGGARAARHEWAVTNPGQASERMADLRRELDRLVADQDDFGSGDDIVLTAAHGGPGSGTSLRYIPRFLGGEALPLAQAPASSTFSSRYDFGASLKNEKASRAAGASSLFGANAPIGPPSILSPTGGHALLDNPYFASPTATEAMISSWRTSAAQQSASSTSGSGQFAGNNTAGAGPSSTVPASLQGSPPKPKFNNLYADDSPLTAQVIGGMPATTFNPTADPSATTPPASFTGSSYYPRTERNGVISTDYGMPNYMGSQHSVASGSPYSVVSPLPEEGPALRSFTNTLYSKGEAYYGMSDPVADITPPTPIANPSVGSTGGELLGGVPLARQGRFNSFPPGRSVARQAVARPSAQETLSSMTYEAPITEQDPMEATIYSPAMSPSTSLQGSAGSGSGSGSASTSPPRRPSPPPTVADVNGSGSSGVAGNGSPSLDDILSPSPSSASTDTSISTPQSPNGSPPLKLYAPYITGGGHRPDMGSDTYFNFVHRYCWGTGDVSTPSSTVTSGSSGSASTALGLAGLSPYVDSNSPSAASTPRRTTPPSTCSASLLASPTGSASGSRTPSPRNGSPALETVSRMEQNGYLHGPRAVEI